MSLTGGTPVVSVREYFAMQHLWTARREAWLCHQRAEQGIDSRPPDRRLVAHATSAVFSGTAFLEAFINGVWDDARDHRGSYTTDGIPDEVLTEMNERRATAEKKRRRLSLMKKFEIPLELNGRPLIPGSEPYESVRLLVELRNSLVHYRPQSRTADTETDLEAGLASRSVTFVQFPGYASMTFSDKVLGPGTAQWAGDIAETFARYWHDQIGITTDFDSHYIAQDPFED